MANTMKHMAKPSEKKVTIGLRGKYVQLHDAYISVVEALQHAGKSCNIDIIIEWINSESITENNVNQLLQTMPRNHSSWWFW